MRSILSNISAVLEHTPELVWDRKITGTVTRTTQVTVWCAWFYKLLCDQACHMHTHTRTHRHATVSRLVLQRSQQLSSDLINETTEGVVVQWQSSHSHTAAPPGCVPVISSCHIVNLTRITQEFDSQQQSVWQQRIPDANIDDTDNICLYVKYLASLSIA